MYSESRPGMRGGHQMCIDVHTGLLTAQFHSVCILKSCFCFVGFVHAQNFVCVNVSRNWCLYS